MTPPAAHVRRMAGLTGLSRSTMRRRTLRAQTVITRHYEEDHREYT